MKKTLRFAAIALAMTMGLSSCMKNNDYFDPNAQWELEKTIIKEFVEADPSLSGAKMHEETGIWYQVITEGERGENTFTYTAIDTIVNTGPSIRVIADAIVEYEGKLLDGTIFDETTKAEGDSLRIEVALAGSNFMSVIPAWIYSFMPEKITVELEKEDNKTIDLGIIFADGLQAGDKVRIITPSAYAYGNFGQGKVPANSPLDFTIKVIDVKEHNDKKK